MKFLVLERLERRSLLSAGASTGTVDSLFGPHGAINLPFNRADARVRGVHQQADGRILLVIQIEREKAQLNSTEVNFPVALGPIDAGSFDSRGSAQEITAQYKMAVPAVAGTYSVRLRDGQVRDGAKHPAAAPMLGSFSVKR